MLFLILSISSSETPQGPSGRPENTLFSENCSRPINVSKLCRGEGGGGGGLATACRWMCKLLDPKIRTEKMCNCQKYEKILDNLRGGAVGGGLENHKISYIVSSSSQKGSKESQMRTDSDLVYTLNIIMISIGPC